ncbi:MAG TPA: MFS transporter [Vicinamibacterales bacterium]|nr:MFS transporter [Vicinamibacterales bacterium]
MVAFPRAVWLLGWVSLATDAATEAIYPLLPFFLTQVLGAGAVSLGIVEGAAEAVNSLVKVLSGRAADRAARKRPLVLFGYSVSSLARPFIAIASTWTQVFAVRVLDRVGKGVRGAPRDAMLAAIATRDNRGRIFGFHRAMDHIGAIVGPVAASAFLLLYPGRYRTLFALTIVPGLIAVWLITRIREAGSAPATLRASEAPERRDRPEVPRAQRRAFTAFMVVLALFTLGNSTDAFLLLKLTDAAGSAKFVPLMWAALHVVKASVSVAGGSWSDRIGRRRVIALGWLVYAIVYAGFAVSTSLAALVAWFMVYGFYFGFAEGPEKALVADLSPAGSRGLAFGIYTSVQGIGALAASVLFGVLWNAFGAAVAFGTGAALALAAAMLLLIIVR